MNDQNRSILVVDDDRSSCLLLRKMIGSLGYSCDFVHTVANGVRAAASKQYSLVLIDSFLPDMRGLEAMHAIKNLPQNGPAPVFIGIMSYENEELQREYASTGLSGVLIKPFSKALIAEHIDRAFPLKHGSCCCSAVAISVQREKTLKSSTASHVHITRNGKTRRSIDLGDIRGSQTMRIESRYPPITASLHLSSTIFQDFENLTFGELNSAHEQ